jgi:hypothetical protein
MTALCASAATGIAKTNHGIWRAVLMSVSFWIARYFSRVMLVRRMGSIPRLSIYDLLLLLVEAELRGLEERARALLLGVRVCSQSSFSRSTKPLLVALAVP